MTDEAMHLASQTILELNDTIFKLQMKIRDYESSQIYTDLKAKITALEKALDLQQRQMEIWGMNVKRKTA